MAEQLRAQYRHQGPLDNRIECVFLTCFRSDFSFLASVLYYSSIRMHRADTLDEADFLLTVTSSTVLLSDTRFLDGSWREALRMVSEVHPHVAALVVADDGSRQARSAGRSGRARQASAGRGEGH